MEEDRPIGVSALAGAAFAAAGATAWLLVLLLVSGRSHPVFEGLPYQLARVLMLGLSVVFAAAVAVGIGLIAHKKWAWLVTAAVASVGVGLAALAFRFAYRVWQTHPAADDRLSMLIHGCWAFVAGWVFLYLGSAEVLDAFRIRRAWAGRVALFLVLAVVVVSGFGMPSRLQYATVSTLSRIRMLASF